MAKWLQHISYLSCATLSSFQSFLPVFRATADIPDPPQCDQLLDCTWPEQGGGVQSDKCQNIPVEPALEATEFTVRAIESESRPVSIKRNKSNLEGSVAIEMSAQPLLELTTGSTVITSISFLYLESWM